MEDWVVACKAGDVKYMISSYGRIMSMKDGHIEDDIKGQPVIDKFFNRPGIEIWKIPPIDMRMSSYMVSNKGRVWSWYKKDIAAAPLNRAGYKIMTIHYDDGTRGTVRVHRIVALIFIPNPDNLPVVDHINRIRSDCVVSNLRWSSYSDNRRNRDLSGYVQGKPVDRISDDGSIKTYISICQAADDNSLDIRQLTKCLNGGKEVDEHTWRWHIDIPPGDEIWKPIPLEDDRGILEASNYGRIRVGSELLRLSSDCNNYLATNIKQKGKYFPQRVHRLVCLAHYGPPPEGCDRVNHIDNNCVNNHISNLEWCDAEHNSKHAYAIGAIKKTSGKPVIQYTLDMKEIARFDTITDAAKAISGNDRNISGACKSKHKAYSGFKWEFASI